MAGARLLASIDWMISSMSAALSAWVAAFFFILVVLLGYQT